MVFSAVMAITSVDSAFAQFNANLDWETSPDKGVLAREAVRYLIVNQPESYSIAGRAVTKNLQFLQKQLEDINKFLPIAPRARGRSSFVGTRFADPAGRGS